MVDQSPEQQQHKGTTAPTPPPHTHAAHLLSLLPLLLLQPPPCQPVLLAAPRRCSRSWPWHVAASAPGTLQALGQPLLPHQQHLQPSLLSWPLAWLFWWPCLLLLRRRRLLALLLLRLPWRPAAGACCCLPSTCSRDGAHLLPLLLLPPGRLLLGVHMTCTSAHTAAVVDRGTETHTRKDRAAMACCLLCVI